MPKGTRPEAGPFNKAVATVISDAFEVKKRTHGVVQQDLAIAAKTSRSQMTRMLSGEKYWDLDQLHGVCRLLQLDIILVIAEAVKTIERNSNSGNVTPLYQNESLETIALDGFAKAANNHDDEGEPI